MEYLLAAMVGLGLAAACGLRAFVPVLAMAVAAKAGWIELGESFAWLSSWPAIAGLLLACLAEVSGSLIPAINHALDAMAAPVATVAGGVVMATQVGQLPGIPDVVSADPMLTWGAGLIAGGGVAAAVHAGSATLRAGSSAISGGLLSPLYGLAESMASVVASILAFVVPVLFAVAFGVIAFILLGGIIWWFRSRSSVSPTKRLGYHSTCDASRATRRECGRRTALSS
ncbi:MAG: DUF4126 domain-containing protein [Phycisphaerae bacterium]|nr:DUF4126 domain-containing protein [Phycisphaerae bacterium]